MESKESKKGKKFLRFGKLSQLIVAFLFGAVVFNFATYVAPPSVGDILFRATTRVAAVFHLPLPSVPPLPGGVSTCPNYQEITDVLTSAFKADPTQVLYGVSSVDSEEYLKWRSTQTEPYLGYPLEGQWEFYLDTVLVKDVSRVIDERQGFSKMLLDKGFTIHPPMDIPLYQYPEGWLARKVGMTKGDYAYLVGIFETSKENYAAMMAVQGGKTIQPGEIQGQPGYITMHCGRVEPEYRAMYERYLSLPRSFTNETTLYYRGANEGLIIFDLLYPGSSFEYLQREFYSDKDGKLTRLYGINNLPPCGVFEGARVGKGELCYEPQGRVFRVVGY